MTAGEPGGAGRRARTADQKEDRRAAILSVAAASARESGFDGVTMDGIARRCGLAKGTLYLYFRTREEVFLALFLDAAHAWTGRMIAALMPGMSDDAAVEALTEAALADPLFIELLSRLTAVIERNAPIEAVIGAKREMFELFTRISHHFEAALDLRGEDGVRFGTNLMALLLGAAQLDSSDIAGRPDLPADVRNFSTAMRFEAVFAGGLKTVLAGLRARPGAVQPIQ